MAKLFWQLAVAVTAIAMIATFYALLVEGLRGDRTLMIVAAILWIVVVGVPFLSEWNERRGVRQRGPEQ